MKKYKKVINTPRMQRIEDSLPQNSFIRKIKKFVMALDLLKLEKYFTLSNYGQHPFPLWVAVCIWLYAYSRGMLIYRKVSELCKTDDYFYWISGGFEPSPAYCEIWKLRILLLIPNILRQVLKYLLKAKLITNTILGLDGFKVHVWASLKQNKTEKSIDKEIAKIDEKLKNETISQKEREKLERRKDKLNDRKKILQERKKEIDNEQGKEKLRINITSPNTAAMQKRNGQWIQGKNVQAVINQDNIVNVHKSTRKSNDKGMLGIMYDDICKFLQVQMLTKYLLVDSGYWELDDVKRFNPEKGYKIIIASPVEVAKSRGKKIGRKSKGYTKEQFRYNTEEDIFVCPNEKILTYKGDSKGKYANKLYRSKTKDCKNCPYIKDCIGSNVIKYKTLQVKIIDEEIQKILEYSNLEEHVELYKRRGVLNEPAHSHMYHNNDITRLHCINGDHIDGEIALLILIDTLKKMWRRHDFDTVLLQFFYVFCF